LSLRGHSGFGHSRTQLPDHCGCRMHSGTLKEERKSREASQPKRMQESVRAQQAWV
jgi:hypothetical protein